MLEKAGYKATKVKKNCQRLFFCFLLVEAEVVEAEAEAIGVEAEAEAIGVEAEAEAFEK